MGLRRAAPAGPPHPRRPAVAFFAGLAIVALALASPIDAYAGVSFSVHMAQHLLLTLLAPPLLALGATRPRPSPPRGLPPAPRLRGTCRACSGASPPSCFPIRWSGGCCSWGWPW